jgi:hypothetical protein
MLLRIPYVGKYSPEGSVECVTCSAGRHTSGRSASANCTACIIGSYLTDAGTDPKMHINESQCLSCE